jgi:hypothetical protein
VNVRGPAHELVVLEGSPDLRVWSPVATNEFSQGTTVFHPAASGVNAIFFRLRVK